MNLIQIFVVVLVACILSPLAAAKGDYAYSLETLPIDQKLVDQIHKKALLTYVIYTFSGDTPYGQPHRQYWRGLIGFDTIEVKQRPIKTEETSGVVNYDWTIVPYQYSFLADVENVEGKLIERRSISPDGSFNLAVDLNSNSVVDYLDVLTPSYEHLVIVSETHGLAFLDHLLVAAVLTQIKMT